MNYAQNASHLNPAALYGTSYDQFSGALQNGTPTPAFNGTFQPPSVVPAKRAHDGDQSMSRSQTPSYNFPNQQAGAQHFPNAPNPYQHLQQQSNNNTPSPTLSNQPFRQPQPQARMQNASPSPFPPQQGNYGNQMSPAMSQQSGQSAGMGQQGQAGGMSQAMTNNMGMPASMAGQMSNAQAQVNAQRIYQMKLQQQ
ncbi:hypothetical protein LTR53_018544, partial [Teratosphaeriaceae sp. CCFEE 6253]